MATDPAKDLVRGYIQSEGVDSTARYVSRGRAYRDLTDEELQAAWVEAFKAWSTDYAQDLPLDDLASEMVLRDLGLPMALIAPEVAEMRKKLAAMGPFSEEAERDLTDKIEAYAKAKAQGSN